MNTDFAGPWSNWEYLSRGLFLSEQKPLRNRSSGIETMKGFPLHPCRRSECGGPAVGMSLSSKGYWIEADGKWMRSTVVVQPGEHPELRPDLPLEAQAELMDNASIAMSEDQQEVVAPNQVDAAGQPVVDLEHIDQDDQVQWVPKRRFQMKKPLIPGSEDAALRMRLLYSNRGECNQEEALENAWLPWNIFI